MRGVVRETIMVEQAMQRRSTDREQGKASASLPDALAAEASRVMASVADTLLPKEGDEALRAHIRGIETMHFGDGAATTGSVIYNQRTDDPKDIRGLLKHYVEQRLIEGRSGDFLAARTHGIDDRNELKQLGTSEDAFLPSAVCTYHLVKGVAGRPGALPVSALTERLGADFLVVLEESVKGTPSLVIERSNLNDAALGLLTHTGNVATFIVGGRGHLGEGLTLWTAHAGLPAKPVPLFLDAQGKSLRADQVPTDLAERAAVGVRDAVTYAALQTGAPLSQTTDGRPCVSLTLQQARDLLGGGSVAVSIRG
jgi:hypothetical protein